MKLYKHTKLQEAFDLFVEQQNALLPNEETVATVTLSEDFKERMRKMLSRQKCGFFVLFGTVGRRVASIMIAILVTATVATIPAYCEPSPNGNLPNEPDSFSPDSQSFIAV